jgi:hypothetical protein
MSIMGAFSADRDNHGEVGAPAGKSVAKFKCGIFRQHAGVVVEGCEPMAKKSLRRALFVSVKFGGEAGGRLKPLCL